MLKKVELKRSESKVFFGATMKRFYKTMKTGSRLQTLTLPMIRKESGSISMRTKGAETRGLVPFAVTLACEMHSRSPSPHTRTVAACASALLDFYMVMSLESYNAAAGKEACFKCVNLYQALSRESELAGQDRHWRMKPKNHMFSELGEHQGPVRGNPKHFWTYADEDFVGWVAKIARARGGARQAGTTAGRVMQKYRALAT